MTADSGDAQKAQDALATFRDTFEKAKSEISKIIVGNDDNIEAILVALFADGHVLLEGIPGIGKTKLVQTLGDVLRLDSSRIQFTPDLMPGDIVGTQILQEDEHGGRTLSFRKGPVFTNILLADEINRATPKTQSALLEAMQEKTVSIGDITHKLAPPFQVLATQNPLEMEGTYPLPEAQLDRFLFKLRLLYPSRDDMHEILERTTSGVEPEAHPVLEREQILDLRRSVRAVSTSREVRDYAIRLTLATHPDSPDTTDRIRRYARLGASPRGAQALLLGGKVYSLVESRTHLACEDVRRVAMGALRHRILLNFEAEAEGILSDDLVAELIDQTPMA